MSDRTDVSAVQPSGPSMAELLEDAAREWMLEDPDRFTRLREQTLGAGASLATSSVPFLHDAERVFRKVTGL